MFKPVKKNTLKELAKQNGLSFNEESDKNTQGIGTIAELDSIYGNNFEKFETE